MDFIRKINKNVQESFSILNEGIQITNSILELSKIHLPQLFQLCPSKNKNDKEGGLCCLFKENKPEIVGGVEQIKTNGLKSKEAGEQTHKSKFLNRLRTGYQEKYDLNRNQVSDPGKILEFECAQGEKCLLKSFSLNVYRESIEFVSFFLNTLSNVLKDSNKASRKLVENQTFLVLFEISKLVEVAVFLRKDNEKVRKIIQDVDSVYSSLVNLVSFSLKLLNEVLQYPLHIFIDNLDKEYDYCRIEKRKYESFLKERYPSQNLDEYDMIGSFWFINITDDQRIDLDQYFQYLDSILDTSNNARSIISYINLMCEQEDDSYKNILYGFLLIFQKLFGYNDLNWHLSENDTNKLYFWNRYYDSCSYYLYYNDCCYDCTKPKMNPNLSAEGDYCTCILSNERCNFRVKIALEEDMKTNKELLRTLCKVLEHFTEVYIKTRVLGLILQIASQIDPFMDLIHKHGIFDSIFETLSECSNDQFYLLNNTLNVVTYQSQNPENFLSLIREEDLKILMTFPPCTIESIMLIHKYVVASKWKVPVKYRKILLNYSKPLTLLYTYYKCTYQSSKTLELSGLFSQILTVVLESVLVAQVALRNLTELNYPFCLHLVSKLRVLENCSDFGEFRDNFDLELFNMLACSYVVLLNLSKSGIFVEYQLFNSISNYLSVSLCFMDKFASDNVVEWMTTQAVNSLHEVYKYMLNVAHTKETNNEEPVRIKMETLLDFGTFPIFQLAVTLFDPYINTRICDKLIKSVSSKGNLLKFVFKITLKMGLFGAFSGLGESLNKHVSNSCHELSIALTRDFEDGKIIFYKKFLLNYTMILLSIDPLSDVPEAQFLTEYNINFLLTTASKIVGILKNQQSVNLQTILMDVLKFLLRAVFSVEYTSLLETFERGFLFELIELSQSGPNLEMMKGIASVILVYLIMLGIIPDEKVKRLSLMCEHLKKLYESVEFKASEVALKADNIKPVDTLGLDFKQVVNFCLNDLLKTTVTDFLEIFYWNVNNYFNFSLPPQIFKILIMFKLYIHPHIFGQLSRFMDISARTDNSVSSKSVGNLVIDDNLLDKPHLLLKTLYSEELEFAKQKLHAMECQLHVISNSLSLTRLENETLRNNIELLKKKLEGPGSEEDFNLELELEIERQRYSHLEEMYNKLLSQLNDLTFSKDNK